jgi:copper(I)-binding protein
VNARRPARTTVALATAAMALGLSSCSYDNPTDMVYNPAIGVHDQSSTVDVLNALVVKGSDSATAGVLVTTLVNNDEQNDDRLTGLEVGAEDQGVSVQLGSSIDVPSGDHVVLEEEGVEVSGEPVQDGAFITLTYTFANAEAVTVDVPVVIQGEGYYEDVETP